MPMARGLPLARLLRQTQVRKCLYISDQWAEKGEIVLGQVPGHNELQVRFCYWESCEDRNNDDDKR